MKILSAQFFQLVMTIKTILILSTASVFCFYSCSNSTGPDNRPVSSIEIPVISGIIITRADGSDEIGRWRNPVYPRGIRYSNLNGSGGIPIELALANPYPNPTTDVFSVEFTLPVTAEVSLWMVKGRLPEENTSPIKNSSGAVFVSPQSTAYAVLVDKQTLTAGHYRETFLGRVSEAYLPTGFYRVYLEADNHLLWKDILIARSKADLPPELRDKYFNVGKISDEQSN